MSKQDEQRLNDANTEQPVTPSATGLGALFAAAGKQAGKANAPKQGKAGLRAMSTGWSSFQYHPHSLLHLGLVTRYQSFGCR